MSFQSPPPVPHNINKRKNKLCLSQDSIKYALDHLVKYGDADVFPYASEFEVINEYYDDAQVKPLFNGNKTLKDFLSSANMQEWKTGPTRMAFIPKHMFGFGKSVQLDPLDTLMYTALVYEIAESIESARARRDVVYSYRFNTNAAKNGQFFDDSSNYKKFIQDSIQTAQSGDYGFVVEANITDFYNQIHHHRLENELADLVDHKYLHALNNLLGQWSLKASCGIPIGSSASRLLAEITLRSVDTEMMITDMDRVYKRFSDDFKFFCKTKVEAYKTLEQLAFHLLSNHGLTLQDHNTKIITTYEFLNQFKADDTNQVSNQLFEIFKHLTVDEYSTIRPELINEETSEKITQIDLLKVITEQIQKTTIDKTLVSFSFQRMSLFGIDICDIILTNINIFYLVIEHVIQYFIDMEKRGYLNNEKCATIFKELFQSFTSIAFHLPFHKMLALHLVSDNPDKWGVDVMALEQVFSSSLTAKEEELIRPYMYKIHSNSNNTSSRSILFTKRTSYNNMGSWTKRIYLLCAHRFTGDSGLHWLSSFKPSNPLEQLIHYKATSLCKK